jgi:predicted ABC-class ATPase
MSTLQTGRPGGARDTPDVIHAMLADLPPLQQEADTIVLWVFRDYEDRWCARKEGSKVEHAFASREEAAAAARATGRAWGSYRLFLELKDGRMLQEAFNLGLHGRPKPR